MATSSQGDVLSKTSPTLNIVNLTKHNITIYDRDDNIMLLLPPEKPARIATSSIKLWDIAVGDVRIPIFAVRHLEATGLPTQESGTIYIVSQLVAEKYPNRPDLFYPEDVIKEKSGAIIGCCSLGTFYNGELGKLFSAFKKEEGRKEKENETQ